MRTFALFLLLATACATAPAAAGARGPGDPCRGHSDCRVGLVCEEASLTCAADECDHDDCDRTHVGEGRCETVEGVTYARTCSYDGVRCLEWTPQACEAGESCQVGKDGAACTPAS
jgi:hypothetical protein